MTSFSLAQPHPARVRICVARAACRPIAGDRASAAARDVYLMIAAMGYFYMSNRFTLAAFLGEELETAPALAHWEAFVIDAVLRTVVAAPGARRR